MTQPKPAPGRAETGPGATNDAARVQTPVEQRWHCQWCGYPSPVPSMNADHEKRCPMRPEGEA